LTLVVAELEEVEAISLNLSPTAGMFSGYGAVGGIGIPVQRLVKREQSMHEASDAAVRHEALMRDRVEYAVQ